MKVWFGCTTFKWPEYRDNYFLLRDYLKELGCIIMGDWIDEVDTNYNQQNKQRNIHDIFKNVVTAIDASDAVVIEYTVPNFSSSHQINYALLKRKPTLVMRLHKDNPRFTDSYLEALRSQTLTLKQYSPKTYKAILEEFIGFSKIEQGQQRYNIVLDKKQKYYLDWASEQYNRSRSEIIRSLIDQEITQDTKYHKYIPIKPTIRNKNKEKV
jgi:hypothetical protein